MLRWFHGSQLLGLVSVSLLFEMEVYFYRWYIFAVGCWSTVFIDWSPFGLISLCPLCVCVCVCAHARSCVHTCAHSCLRVRMFAHASRWYTPKIKFHKEQPLPFLVFKINEFYILYQLVFIRTSQMLRHFENCNQLMWNLKLSHSDYE
jgi:hypothetical protein